MISFGESVANICGVELSSLVSGGKYTVYGGKYAVIEGHSGVTLFSQDNVSFAYFGKTLSVNGTNLTIKCLSKGFAVVGGNVHGVEVTDV